MRILACSFVAAVCFAMGAQAANAQSLVYMLTYGTTPASFHARFPNGIFGTTPAQRVAMTRQTLKNEIWSASLRDGKRTLLFSDEGMGFEISPAIGGYAVDSTRNVVYVKAVERTWEAPPKRATPGVYETPKGVYGIALDGSRHFRRLFDARENMNALMVNRAGTRLAFGAYENPGVYNLYVYELPSAKLITKTNITAELQTRCGGCLPQESGWLADGTRIFLTLEEGDDDADDAPTGAPLIPGVYLFSEDGKDLGSLPMHAGEMNLPDYKREPSTVPYLIAQAADGTFLFRDFGQKKGPPPKPPIVLDTVLVFTGADFAPQKQLLLAKRGCSGFAFAPDSKFLAFVEDRQLPTYKTERHIWARNLQTGEDKELLMTPPPNPPNSPQPSPSAVILGWLEK
jgi:hypothetical protein